MSATGEPPTKKRVLKFRNYSGGTTASTPAEKKHDDADASALSAKPAAAAEPPPAGGAARRVHDPSACLDAAREAVRVDSAHPMGWRNLCWSLWTLRRYADASAACRSAAAHRDWRPQFVLRVGAFL